MRPEALIFDLDGTLLDTLGDIGDAMNASLVAHGWAPHSPEAYRRMVGDGAQMLAARAVPAWHQGDAVAVDSVYRVYLEAYGRHWANTSRAYEGIPTVLDACVAQGIKIAVYSNKADHFAQQVTRHLLPGWPWEVIRGQVAAVPRKPAPDGAVLVAQALGVAPSRCWFLGDSGVDIECAVGAGMRALGALWGFRSRAELEEAGADALLACPVDVVGLF
jgi:phosphoglycolate phosphatase